MPTEAPRDRSLRVIARPNPDAAPVISATLPDSDDAIPCLHL
jgi:hypothetical protein